MSRSFLCDRAEIAVGSASSKAPAPRSVPYCTDRNTRAFLRLDPAVRNKPLVPSACIFTIIAIKHWNRPSTLKANDGLIARLRRTRFLADNCVIW